MSNSIPNPPEDVNAPAADAVSSPPEVTSPGPDSFTPVPQTADSQTPEAQAPKTMEFTPVVSEVPEGEATAIGTDEETGNFSKDTDWFALARKLRQHNRELIKTVVKLEQALNESQEKLQHHIKKTRSTENLITQQTEELNSNHEQINRLYKELETAHHHEQKRQEQLEELQHQLQASQTQFAELERECAQLQQTHSEQAHQLTEQEQTIRELKTRLFRQQQQALQFKSALDQCLEPGTLPGLEADPEAPRSNNIYLTTANLQIARAKAIQPWSNQGLSSEEAEPEEPLVVFPQAEGADDEDPLDDEDQQLQETLENILGELEQGEGDFVLPLDPDEVEVGDLMEITEALENHDNGIPELSAAILTPDSESLKPDSEEEMGTETATAEVAPAPEEKAKEPSLPFTTMAENLKLLDQLDRQEAQQHPQVSLPKNHSPSPQVYPLRPQKKRKSLAAVELPTFL